MRKKKRGLKTDREWTKIGGLAFPSLEELRLFSEEEDAKSRKVNRQKRTGEPKRQRDVQP